MSAKRRWSRRSLALSSLLFLLLSGCHTLGALSAIDAEEREALLMAPFQDLEEFLMMFLRVLGF